MDFTSPQNLNLSIQPINELDLLNPYMIMSINDAQEAETNDYMATFVLQQLVKEVYMKNPKIKAISKLYTEFVNQKSILELSEDNILMGAMTSTIEDQ